MAGDASVGSIDELERQFMKIHAMKPKVVVMDMSDLNFIASIGMGTIVSLQRSVTRTGGVVKLAGVNDDILGAFQRSGLDKVFEIHADANTALG